MAERHRTFKAEGIVIKHQDWGEADRIITVFTRELGKVRMVAKGARKVQSRKGGHVEPFTHILAQLDRTSDLPIINQVETLEPFMELRDSLENITVGLYVMELVDRFTRDEEGEDLPLFQLLRETLLRLAASTDKWPVLCYFQLRLLDVLGYRPSLFHCAVCQRKIEPVDQYFSPMQGGVVCPACGEKHPNLWKIQVEPLRFLRHFQRSTFDDAAKAQVHPAVREKIDKLIEDHLSFLLERKLNSPRFLNSIK